jgi:hypothetical protein
MRWGDETYYFNLIEKLKNTIEEIIVDEDFDFIAKIEGNGNGDWYSKDAWKICLTELKEIK